MAFSKRNLKNCKFSKILKESEVKLGNKELWLQEDFRITATPSQYCSNLSFGIGIGISLVCEWFCFKRDNQVIHYVEQWIDDLPFDGDGDNSNENFGRLDCNRIPDEEKPSICKSVFFKIRSHPISNIQHPILRYFDKKIQCK